MISIIKNTSQSQLLWQNMKVNKNKNGLLIGDFSVVEYWELPIQKKLADLVCMSGGNILEIGFGLGLASKQVRQNTTVNSHWILESHPKVFEDAEILYGTNSDVKLINDFWENQVENLKDDFFSGVIFDCYPIQGFGGRNVSEVMLDLVIDFSMKGAHLLNGNGVLGFIDLSKEIHKSDTFFSSIEMWYKSFSIHYIDCEVPQECSYANSHGANIVCLSKT